MHRPTRPRLRTLSLTLTLGALVALFGAGAAHATEPEACSAEPADEAPSNRIALFDVYWNDSNDSNDPNSKTLVNNPCPPTVVHTPAYFDEETEEEVPAVDTRTASHIHIDHTIIHIPESAKQTVTLGGTGHYNGRAYDFLRPRSTRTAPTSPRPRCILSPPARRMPRTRTSAWALPPAC